MRRIAVFYTGGTLGMRASPNGLVPALEGIAERVARLAPLHVECAFEAFSPLIDSAAATPANWERIACRLAALRDEFDGFVVLHGTDTLAWTASALAFLLPGFGKPIVLTGAQKPFSIVGSDAPDNVADALAAACFMHLTEVTVAFGRRLWRACRVRKHESVALDAFATPGLAPLAEFEPEVLWHAALWRVDTVPFSLRPFNPNLRVAMVMMSPGATVACLAEMVERSKLDGLVLLSYGSGNTPDDPRLLAALARAIERGTVVVNVSQVWNGSVDMNAYATGSALAAIGVWSGGELTPEAAQTKLQILLSADYTPEQRRVHWISDWAGEGAPGLALLN